MRAVAVALLLLAGCGPQASDTATETLAVEVVSARAYQYSRSVEATATAAFVRESTLSFRVPGVISRLEVNVGDSVRAGQVLAVLAAPDLEARVRERQADLARAERALNRMERLSASGVIAGADFDDQRDIVGAARAALASARYDLNSAALTAPFAGVVLERVSEAGQTVSPGGAVLRLGDTSGGMLLQARVVSMDASRLSVGDTATAFFGEGREQTVRVVRIGRDTDRSTGTRRVDFGLSESLSLASGDTARVRFLPLDASELIAIPAEAYVPAASGGAVFALNSDQTQVRQIPVRLIRFEGDDALISGLDPGALVVTAGAGFVRDGQTVRAVREP